MDTLYFKVADVCFSIAAAEARTIKGLLPSYAPFHLSKAESTPILHAQIEDGAVDTTPEGDELGQFDCGGTNHGVYKISDGYKIIISTAEGRAAAAMTASADFSRCTVSLFGDTLDRRFGLGNALMIAFAFSAARYDIVLMHASVTMNGGFGYLFLGKSGTGKSTHSSLWRQYIPGSDLLNDDNPAVRVFPTGEVYVYGTPWSGKTPCYRNLRMPVGAFVRLEQYPRNEIVREAPLAAFASILSSCSTMIWDKASYTPITATVEGIIRHVPAYYLKCRADREAAECSYQTIARR